jgi:hypothetical protein
MGKNKTRKRKKIDEKIRMGVRKVEGIATPERETRQVTLEQDTCDQPDCCEETARPCASADSPVGLCARRGRR